MLKRFFLKNNNSHYDQIVFQNSLYSLIARGIRAISVFLQVRILLELLGTNQYGTWATLASILVWIAVFDLGIGSGFRNNLVEALSKNDKDKARKLVSTAYIFIGLLFSIILLFFYISTIFVDWPQLLSLRSSGSNLNLILLITATFIVLNIIATLYREILTAHNLTAHNEIVLAVGECVIITILLIFRVKNIASLMAVAIVCSAVPFLTMTIASIVGYVNKYNYLKPSIKYYDQNFVGLIANLGLKFFVIQVASLVMQQSARFFLNKEINEEAAAIFDATFKYFSASALIFYALITPYFPIITTEYVNKNHVELQKIKKRLLKIWGLMVVLLVIMLLCSTFVYRLWLGSTLAIPFEMSLAMCCWYIVYFFCAVYYHILSSMSHLGFQAGVYVVAAVVCMYLFIVLSESFQMLGVPMAFCIVMGVNGLIMFAQVERQLSLLKNRQH